MHKLNLTKEALGFVQKLEPKQFKQVMNKILGLLSAPMQSDSSSLKGYENLYRVDIGEHRAVYRFDDENVYVLVLDERNDDAVYEKLARKNI